MDGALDRLGETKPGAKSDLSLCGGRCVGSRPRRPVNQFHTFSKQAVPRRLFMRFGGAKEAIVRSAAAWSCSCPCRTVCRRETAASPNWMPVHVATSMR